MFEEDHKLTLGMEEIRSRYRREFEFAKVLIRQGEKVGLMAAQKSDDMQLPSDLPKQTAELAQSLFSKAFNTTLAVIELTERSLVEDAMVLSRCLYETHLALHFVLRPILTLNAGKGDVAAAEYSRDERAWMYVTHAQQHLQKLLMQLGISDGNADQRKDALKELGDRLKGKSVSLKALEKSFRGVTLKDLADRLGVIKTYETDYANQSSFAHAADALIQNVIDENVPLLLTCRYFLACTIGMNKYFEMAFGNNLDQLIETLQQLEP